jgi:cell division protease FtsH
VSNGKGSEERRSPRQERDPRNRIPPPKLGPPDLRRSSRTVVFWLLLLLAAITVFNFLQTRRGQEQDIAYSHFREQLGRSNIRRVTFVERQVSGVLVHPDTVFVKGRAIEYTRFRTTLPFDDPALVNQLEAKKVEVEAKAPSMWGSFLLNSLPWIGIAIVWFFIFRQMQSGPKGVFTFGKSRARMVSEDKPRVTFADVAGADEAKEELQEIIEFLKDPQKFQRLGGKIPKGALLLGPPGTGKTLMARAIAGEAGVPFFSMSGSDFVEMFVGVGASRVRDLFDTGKHHAPCIIFIDELDAVGRHRGAGLGGGHDEREQTLNQLLVEMDGFESNEGVILLAATNRPDVLDPALLRPGRFDRQIVVDRPDINGREGILKVHTRKIPISEDVDLKILARGTPGFSGADLANMVNEAALLAARYNRKKVAMQDFESAKDRVLMGLERKSMLISEEERRNTAYHEAGHVLVSKMIPGSDPIHKVTIIPRGRALGVTQQLPVDEKHNYSRTYCLDKIAFILGGTGGGADCP